MRFSSSTKLVVRISDNAVFEPSFPDDYGPGELLAEFLSFRTGWYFRHILPQKGWFFRLTRSWKRTGVIWVPQDPHLFNVVIASEAWRIANGK